MKPADEVYQALWELHYDLLPDDEARQWRQRLNDDPALRDVFESVKAQASVVARAARVQQSTITMNRPGTNATTATRQRTNGTAMGRFFSRLAVLAATVLIGATGFLYFKADSPLRETAVASAKEALASQHVRTLLVGPSVLEADVAQRFDLQTLTVLGKPVSTDVEYRLFNADGELALQNSTCTDQAGKLAIELPASFVSTDARMEVDTYDEHAHTTLTTHLRTKPTKFVTYLTVDKPLYRPGETVFYRSLTISRSGMKAKQDLPVEYEIEDPSGAPVPDSLYRGFTQRGVGNGTFALPGHLPGGTYTLIVRSPEKAFPEETREFVLRQYRTPRLKKELEFVRDSYGPGDEVTADFAASRIEGGSAESLQVRVVATVDGQDIHSSRGETNRDGTYHVQFGLPETIERGEGSLAIIVDDGGTQETIAKTIPINLGKVEVQFYPEGGELVAGVKSRVYFYAHDPLQKPVHVAGVVCNDAGKEVAKLETVHGGRGRFELTPNAHTTYTLSLSHPTGADNSAHLPVAAADTLFGLNTGEGVFPAGEPITVTVISKDNQRPLTLAAVCRGATVGQAVLPPTDDAAPMRTVSVPLEDRIGGVLRLTLFDYSTTPPTPVAERLVFRESNRKLNVDVGRSSRRYSPGESVDLTVTVTDERNRPVPAVLGVAVVDSSVMNLADDKSPEMMTQFLLATEIEKPEDLEDANFYLQPGSESRRALDLLLGTQGWRRFVEIPPAPQLAASESSENHETAAASVERLLALNDTTAPPLLCDSLEQAQAAYNDALVDFQQRRESDIRRYGRAMVVAASLCLLVLAFVAVFRIVSLPRVALPSLGVALVCLCIGLSWMGTRVASFGGMKTIAFADYGSQTGATGNQDLESNTEAPSGLTELNFRADDVVSDVRSKEGLEGVWKNEIDGLERKKFANADPVVRMLQGRQLEKNRRLGNGQREKLREEERLLFDFDRANAGLEADNRIAGDDEFGGGFGGGRAG